MESKESVELKVLCSTPFVINALSHFSRRFSTLRQHYFMNSEDLLSNHKILFLPYRNIGSSCCSKYRSSEVISLTKEPTVGSMIQVHECIGMSSSYMQKCCWSTKRKSKEVEGTENLPEQVSLGQVTSLLSDPAPRTGKEQKGSQATSCDTPGIIRKSELL